MKLFDIEVIRQNCESITKHQLEHEQHMLAHLYNTNYISQKTYTSSLDKLQTKFDESECRKAFLQFREKIEDRLDV